MDSTYTNAIIAGVAIFFVWAIFAIVQVQDNQVRIEDAITQARELGREEGRAAALSGEHIVYIYDREDPPVVIGSPEHDFNCLPERLEFRIFYGDFDDLQWLENDHRRLKEQLRMSSYYAASFNAEMLPMLPPSKSAKCTSR